MAQKNEKFLFRILNSITDPMAIYDRHYRISLINQALVNLYELPEANVVGRYCYEVFHKRSSMCENCHVREVFQTGETRRREMNVTLPNGQQRYFVIHCYPLRDRDGQVVQAIEHGRDVTEPRNLQHQLKVSEERYRTLVENAREGIFMIDAEQARLTFANRCMGEMLGYAPEEILGRSMFEFMDEEAAAIARAQLEQRQQGIASVYELTLKCRDGSDLVGLVSAAPLKINTTYLGSVGIITDITRRKRTEAELQLAKEFTDKIINGITDHLTVIDPRTYRIVQANNSFLDRVGLEAGAVLGKPCFEIIFKRNLPCHVDGTWCSVQETMRLKQGVVGERMYPDNGGREHILQVATYPLLDTQSEIDLIIRLETDVTEKRQTEADLAFRSRELQRTQHQLETLFEISRQVSSNNSLGELIDSLQEIIQEIFAESDSLFLILDAGCDQFLPLQECAAVVGEPVKRFLLRLEQAGAMGEFIQYLREVSDPQVITMAEHHRLPPFLEGVLDPYLSWFGLPIFVRQVCIGFFFLGSQTSREYLKEDLHFIHALFAQNAGYIRHLVIHEVKMHQSRQQESDNTNHGGIIGNSKKMHEIYELIDLISKSDATVLITGENGTGKELVAQAIHRQSHRHRDPFIVANCSAYSPTLLESELFGHERGAFTGAIRQRKGRIERSHGGTLFLDEIGDISPATQVLLLRFLQDHCFERVGGERPIEADVRVLAATNRDLRRLAEAGQFRDDLYYRLNVISIHLPLLRERREDIPLLAVHFLKKYNLKEGKSVVTFGADAMEALMDYDWPGNVRQLENAVSHAIILAQGDVIRRQHLPRFLRESATTSASTSLAENERYLILRVLQESNWNKHDAAKRLQVSRSTLYSKIRRYGLEKNYKGSFSIQN
ncbi:MAG: sigma 54-interacting transcriptional regulator [Desulfobacterales bacterium]|nr:sigma 54-interacting transcriptional regulator [Desulfobacterales bacterium]